MTAQHVSDDPLLAAYRIVLRIAREKKAQRCAAAETPPGAQKEGPAPQQAPASSSHPSTATCPLSCGEDRRA
jgi:hypothetical protein